MDNLAVKIEDNISTQNYPFIDLQTGASIDEKTNSEEGIPVLLRDKKQIDVLIKEARQSDRSNWYDDKQDIQFTGPYRHHMAKRRGYLEKILPTLSADKFEMALDIGCGDGNHTQWLEQYATNVYGSDYNLTRLLRAQNRLGRGRLALADVTDYPANDNIFDLVFFHHVLEHVPDDAKALQEVHRILKPGGVLVLGVPNEGAKWWQWAYKFQPRLMETTDHVHFYTMDMLRERVLKNDFSIVDEEYIGWGLPHFGYDSMVRGVKIIDDLFSFFGRLFIKKQASSLFMILRKN